MRSKQSKPSQREQVSGTFFKCLHRSGNSTRSVCQYSNAEGTVTVVGDDLPEACLGVTFYGHWRVTKKGKQFYSEMAVSELPTKKEQIADYISSLKLGIPVRWALQMVDAVGENHFWEELDVDPMQFCSIPGVIPDAITSLQIQAGKIAAQQSLFQLFGDDLSCTSRQYKRVVDFFHNDLDRMVQTIQENPFTLLRCGFSFVELDRFCAYRTIFPVNDYRRLLAATQEVLLAAKAKSHVGLPHDVLVSGIQKMLVKQGAVSEQDICIFLCSAGDAGEIIFSGSLYYLPRSYREESTINDIALRLLCKEDDALDDTAFEETMEEYAKAKGFSLSSDQKKAVKTAMEKSIVVITGGPGTGKSTILDAILTCWKKFHDDNWLLMAPTGKAAVRMTETTGQPASTIHSTLGLNVGNEDTENMDTVQAVLDASLIIVDESSMLDQTVMASLAMALSQDTEKVQHLILVGDPQQLPSVGWGNVLADFISSDVVPVCRLNTIYRQGAGNPIITNSGKMQVGDTNLDWNRAFRRYHEGSDAANKKCACRLFQRCVGQFGIENVAMLSPYHHATEISTDSLNHLLQDMMNPKSETTEITALGRTYRKGDRVMQLRNVNGLSNGDIGTITFIDLNAKETEPCVYVRFENGIETEYIRGDLGQLELAYAISIHKSQGSQYKAIIIVLPNRTTPFLKRNILYTAITRSSCNVAIVSPTATIDYCILNEQKDDRYTNLAARLNDGVTVHLECEIDQESGADAIEYIFSSPPEDDDFDF